MAGSFNLPDMQEGLAGAVGHLDEAEALVRIEPFHLGLGLGSRCRWIGWLPRGPFIR
jgi:hypothetical protein